MEKITESKFDNIFPLIQDAIRKLCPFGEWVYRDSIVNEIIENPIVENCYKEYKNSSSKNSKEKWVKDVWVINEVAHFSQAYTIIKNSFAKELAKNPKVKEHFSQIDPPLNIKFEDWIVDEVDSYSPILKKYIKNLEIRQKYLSEFERKKTNKKDDKWLYKVRASRTFEKAQKLDEIQITEEIDKSEKNQFYEGSVTQILVNKYERSGQARIDCIDNHGLNCKICGFNFETIFGEIGKGFIHVHHLIPIHTIGKDYVINPETDLVPVCPNCHAMLHMRKPDSYTVEELKEIIRKRH